MLEGQELTLEEAKYLVNVVLLGKMQYHMQTAVVSEGVLRAVDSRVAVAMKRRIGMHRCACNDFLFTSCHKGGFGLTSAVDLQHYVHVVEGLLRLNSDSLAGRVARARLLERPG